MRTILRYIIPGIFLLIGYNSFSQSVSNSIIPLKATDTLTLKVMETKFALNNSLKIKFSSFSHEHSSSSPADSFSATTGVYFFEITVDDKMEPITIYTGVEGRSRPFEWKSYTVTMLSATEDQRAIVVSISAIK